MNFNEPLAYSVTVNLSMMNISDILIIPISPCGFSFYSMEVNSKDVPEMTTEEVIGLRDFDDAFALTQSEKECSS